MHLSGFIWLAVCHVVLVRKSSNEIKIEIVYANCLFVCSAFIFVSCELCVLEESKQRIEIVKK